MPPRNAASSTTVCRTGAPSADINGRRTAFGMRALDGEERDGLRRLIDERKRERLGFSTGDPEVIRRRILRALVGKPQTTRDLAETTRLAFAKTRGAVRHLAASGEIEIARRGPPHIWRLAKKERNGD